MPHNSTPDQPHPHSSCFKQLMKSDQHNPTAFKPTQNTYPQACAKRWSTDSASLRHKRHPFTIIILPLGYPLSTRGNQPKAITVRGAVEFQIPATEDDSDRMPTIAEKIKAIDKLPSVVPIQTLLSNLFSRMKTLSKRQQPQKLTIHLQWVSFEAGTPNHLPLRFRQIATNLSTLIWSTSKELRTIHRTQLYFRAWL